MTQKHVQTKRSPLNKHKWEKRVAHALRVLNKKFYYKWKGKGE